MECTYTCRIDELGRIVLPRELRKKLGWSLRDTLLLRIDDDTIILKLSKKDLMPNDIFCGAHELY